jgi:hypothetical protein
VRAVVCWELAILNCGSHSHGAAPAHMRGTCVNLGTDAAQTQHLRRGHVAKSHTREATRLGLVPGPASVQSPSLGCLDQPPVPISLLSCANPPGSSSRSAAGASKPAASAEHLFTKVWHRVWDGLHAGAAQYYGATAGPTHALCVTNQIKSCARFIPARRMHLQPDPNHTEASRRGPTRRLRPAAAPPANLRQPPPSPHPTPPPQIICHGGWNMWINPCWTQPTSTVDIDPVRV